MSAPLILDYAPPPVERTAPTPAERLAAGVLQAGAVAVVLAAVTWRAFELDRFFVPKELVLHLAALAAGVLALGAIRRTAFQRGDLLLALFLLLTVASAVFATNPWLAARATTLTASGLALFWTARALGRAGLGDRLLGGLALAVVVGAGTSLLQTYGVQSEFFSTNRAPGGTFGNRNFVAHVCALGLPVVLLAALRARRLGACLLWAGANVLVVAVLVLTRSRAAWLALAAVLAVFAAGFLLAPALRHDQRSWRRLGVIGALCVAGIAAVMVLPNTLRWRSENPYLESVTGVANFQQGSGRGRVIQYRETLGMALRHPLLGVGPGNWAVVYPEHAEARDPSLDRNAGGMTSNPWPSSDWVAFVSERGFLATLLLAAGLGSLGLAALRRGRSAFDSDDALAATALLATLAATVIAGLFDAVLLLAAPAFLAWTTLGALHSRLHADTPATYRPRRTLTLAVVLLLPLAGGLRSAAQLAAMGLYTTDHNTWMGLGARLDPGNYRVHLTLARRGSRAQRCQHALAARELYPQAAAARRLARGCR